jgi:hypothetical protein
MNELTQTTLEIAERTGKRHDNVLRDTRNMLTELYGEGGLSKFRESFTADNGHTYTCYRLPKHEADLLMTKYRVRTQNKKSLYVYLLECQGFYKIGITRNVVERLKACQTGNPFEIKLVYYDFCSRARTVEGILHALFKDKNVRGEWFKLSDKDIYTTQQIIEEN